MTSWHRHGEATQVVRMEQRVDSMSAEQKRKMARRLQKDIDRLQNFKPALTLPPVHDAERRKAPPRGHATLPAPAGPGNPSGHGPGL